MDMKRLIVVIAAVAAALSFIVSAAIVKGRFVDVKGAPIKNVVFKLTNEDDSAFVAVSGEDGGYALTLPGGAYKFEMSAHGYKSIKGIFTPNDSVIDLTEQILQADPDARIKSEGTGKELRAVGKIVKTGGKPLEFASIRFLTTDSVFLSGGATDASGQFKFNVPEKDEYIVIVSSLGYMPVAMKVKAGTDGVKLAKIELSPESRELDEVTVKAQAMTRVDSHLQIIPDKMSVKHASTGYQLLRNLMIPALEVDPFDGIVTLYGQKVSLYINGAPAGYRLVQNLRPKDVEKIEYHDAPVGRYAMDFAAINFITKRKTTGGYATLDAQQAVGGYLSGNYNGFTKINKGNTSYYAFAGYNMQNGAADAVEKTERFNLDSRTVDRAFSSIGGRERAYGEYGQINIEHVKDRKYQSVHAGVSGRRSVDTSMGRMTYSEPVSITQTTDSRTGNRALGVSSGYYGQFGLRKNDLLIVSANGSFSRSKYNYIYFADENDVTSHTRDKVFNFNPQVTYILDLGHRNQLFFSLMDYFRSSSTDYAGTYSSWQHMWKSETLLLVEYTHRVSSKLRFSARPGLSMVNVSLHGYEKQNTVFPRFFTQLTYNPTRQSQLSFDLAIGNSVPSLSARTAAEQPIDLIMSRRGNPLLKNFRMYESNISYSLQLGRVNIASRLSGRYYPDFTTIAYFTEGDHMVLSYLNGDYKSATFAPDVTWKITDNFRVSGGASLSHTERSDHRIKQQLNSASGTVGLMYFLGDFSFNLKGNTTNRFTGMDYSYAFTPMNAELSIGWTHGGWRVDAWARTSSRQKKRRWIDVGNYMMNTVSHGRFYGMVKVAYTFDFGKKIQRSQRQANTSIDSNILK